MNCSPQRGRGTYQLVCVSLRGDFEAFLPLYAAFFILLGGIMASILLPSLLILRSIIDNGKHFVGKHLPLSLFVFTLYQILTPLDMNCLDTSHE